MASVNKVKIESTTYDVSPSPTGTLDTTSTTKFISNDVDQASATSYTSVNKIAATETNSSIFSKLTSMVRNTRYLHNKVGTTDISSIGDSVTAAISALSTRAPATHSHTTTDLPVSNSQINSSSYIPTSALIYSMNETLTSLNDAITIGEDITTNTKCGGIFPGTTISSSSTLQSIIKDMIYIPEPPGPNDQYESISIGTWNTATDVDNFFNTYTPSNNWNGLKLGNYVTINDGVYNTDWVIAGFNMEYNQIAADDTKYNNGYGICMIPKTTLPTKANIQWDSNNSLANGYKSSTIHNTLNTTITNNLKTVLGDHLINRNVLLSSKCDGIYPKYQVSMAYEWDTAYVTLMSVGQLTGTFASHQNKYDDGEANYRLPLFNYENIGVGFSYWTRNVFGCNVSMSSDSRWAFDVVSNSTISTSSINSSNWLRPFIYLR